MQTRSRSPRWMGVSVRRLGVVGVGLLLYLVLATWSFLRSPLAATHNGPATWWLWASFGLSLFNALLFLCIGAFVWLYTRPGLISRLLNIFAYSIMVTFLCELPAAANDPPMSLLSGISAGCALLLFVLLVCLFPQNILSGRSRTTSQGFIRIYLAVLFCTFPGSLLWNSLFTPFPDWFQFFIQVSNYVFNLLALGGPLIILPYTSRLVLSPEARQQHHLFLTGVILAVSPLLFLSVLPQIFYWPAHSTQPDVFLVDPQISTLPMILLPMSLAYALLRSQILVVDLHIRQTIAWIVGTVSLVVCAYLLVLTGSLAAPLLLLGIGLVVPLILRFARAVAARMLRVTSQASFHSLLSEPEALTALTALQDDLPALAATLTRTAAHVFHAPAAVLLLLDEASASYQWHQSVSQGNHDAMALAHTLRRHLGSSSPSMPPFADNEFSAAWWIEASKLAPLLQIRRPLFVRELVQIHEHGGLPNGIFRFLRHPLPSTLPERSQVEGSLLVPIRWQGRLIAVLLLAARESAQQDGYGGPDFEPLAQFVTTCTPALAQARLLSRVTLRMQVVESLSQRLPRHAATSLAETAQALTEVVAAVLRVQATLWHREATMGKIALSPQERGWFCLAMSLSPEDTTTAGSRQAQALAFLLAVQGQERFVSGLEHAPAQRLSAQVCLPLGVQEPSHQDALDVLVLTYAEPHHFAADEQMVLRQLARHCASSLHHTRLLVEIHQALHQQQVSEQQKHVALTRLLTTVQQAIESKRLLLTSARDAAAPRTARYVKREQHAGLLEEKGAPSFFAYEQASWLRSVKELLVLLEEDTHHVSRLHEASSDDLSTRVRREILTILAEKDLVASLPGEPRSLVLICRPSRLQMFLEDVLRIAGYPVQVYASGDALLDALGKHPQPPSLILLEPAAASLPLSALGLAFSKYWTYHGRLPLLLLPLGPTHIFSAEHPEDQDLQNSSGLALVRLASPLRVSNLLHSIARVLEDSEMTR